MLSHLKHVHVFQAVCEAGNMKAAGERLGRAQSAVSRSIEELESALRVELFERHARGVLLTSAGKVVLKRVEFALGEMEAARKTLAPISSAGRSSLRHAPIFSLTIGRRQLEILFALTAPRHLSSVAKELDISQPAVSMAARNVEASAGLKLFDRTAAGMRLTRAGELLVHSLKRATAQLRLATAELAEMQGMIEGRVTVGDLPFSRTYILPVAIANLLHLHPGLQIATVEGSLGALMADLRCGDIDFILGALQSSTQSEELVRESLFSDRMAVIARAGHPLAGRGALNASELADALWILPGNRVPTRNVAVAALRSLGLKQPRAAVESSDLSIIRGLLIQSDMITVASRHLFHYELTAGSLVTLPVSLPDPVRSIGILRRSHDHLSPGAKLLINEIRALRGTPDTPDLEITSPRSKGSSSA